MGEQCVVMSLDGGTLYTRHDWNEGAVPVCKRCGLRQVVRSDQHAHGVWRVVTEVVEERARQDAKWGMQPMPDTTGDWTLVFDDPAFPSEVFARTLCEYAAKRGTCSHAHVFFEEVLEALTAARRGMKDDLRKELVQVAAVCVKWIEQIDRRGQ